MISYNQSQQILTKVARSFPVESETITLEESTGRILTHDVVAREPNPLFDNSAMDGFAVNHHELVTQFHDDFCELEVQSLIAAGDAPILHDIKGAAIEIMTGAKIPSPYYDTVIRIEDVEVVHENSVKKIRLRQVPHLGANIRKVGEDFKEGQILLKKGTKVNHQHLMALATQGIDEIEVGKKVKIGIVSTGKEIVEYKKKALSPGQIRNSTGVYLLSYLKSALQEVVNFGNIEDDENTYIKKIKEAFDQDIQVVLSTGAVSMGVYDFVRSALEKIGATIHFHKCAIRPGKPILFASLLYKNRMRFIFGLPGNPVSTAVGLRFFVMPFLNTLQGRTEDTTALGTLIKNVQKPEGLTCFFKAKTETLDEKMQVESLPGQASFMVSPLIKSNAWILLPDEGTIFSAGTNVEVISL
ncbi:MAG: molybdopterin molybdotransferase MoeA [Pseudobdellovibrionaceae bacterium]